MTIRKTATSGSAVVKKQARSKRLTKPKQDFVSRTGVILTTCYCRKCMKTKKHDEFYEAVDNGLVDANGKFSVCKDCCNDLFNNFYSQHNSIEKALLQTCRILNLRYDEVALGFMMGHLNTMLENDKEVTKIFGIYKAKLMQSQKSEVGKKDLNEDFTFVEPSYAVVANPLDDNEDGAHDLIMFWGQNLERDDYIWLENELSEWKKTHKSDTKAEETLLKEICYKGLEIRNARRDGKSPGSLVKEYQELMKTANVDPAKTAIAGAGKAQDTFSSFIKTIEQNEPAEYYEDKKLFKDVDNIDFYFKKNVVRPLKNFITGSRDFNMTDDSEDELEDIDIEEILKDGE